MLNMMFNTGLIMLKIIDVPPKIGKIRNRRMINPYWLKILSQLCAMSSGRRAIRIFPPSRGCIGIKLKIAKMILIYIKGTRSTARVGRT